MIQFLNDIAKSEDFGDIKMIDRFKKNVKQFKLSEELIERLKAEEVATCQTSEKRIIMAPSSMTEFKHYFKSNGKYAAVNFKNKTK